jgi:hypothetical protein
LISAWISVFVMPWNSLPAIADSFTFQSFAMSRRAYSLYDDSFTR